MQPKPMLIDCLTFRNMLGKYVDSMEEDRAADQLLNLLKVRTLTTHMVDLSELHRLLTTETHKLHEHSREDKLCEIDNNVGQRPIGSKPEGR